MARIAFECAKARYVHRFTMDHTPEWAKKPMPNGFYYAPQFASDWEWYSKTKFPGEPGLHGNCKHCETGAPTWPIGQTLSKQYAKSTVTQCRLNK